MTMTKFTPRKISSPYASVDGFTYRPDCRFFNGYKPCRSLRVCSSCKSYSPMGTRILIINLESLGTVLRTTSLLRPLKRRYGKSFISWLTAPRAVPLLENNPFIDRVYPYNLQSVTLLMSQQFDVVLGIDKSLESASLASSLPAKRRLGIGLSRWGNLAPLNPEAGHFFRLGLDDRLKFHKNTKPETQLICEAMGFSFRRDEYIFRFRPEEREFIRGHRKKMGLRKGALVLGYNTGCSDKFSYKRLSFQLQRELLSLLIKEFPGAHLVLLGGPEDSLNNSRLKVCFGSRIISTPTEEGLRKGLCYMDLCDLVITGDSLGMHMAIALKKPVVVWFGLSCPQEIDLYGRGEKVSASVDCSPCWRPFCDRQPKCNERVDVRLLCKKAKLLLRRL